ncbi:MAG: nucleoside monophosphate kinase [bacterium]|nr:nucleoside monophosphate kinase [bacterium]
MQIYSIIPNFNINNRYNVPKQSSSFKSYNQNIRLLNVQHVDTVNFGNKTKLKQPIIIALFGPPNGGKSTLAKLLSEYLGIVEITTGNIFRAEIKKGTPLGLEMKSYMNKGELIPDKLCDEILWQRFTQDDCKNGFILDGYPRTVKHAKKINRYLKNHKGTKFKVINLNAEKQLLFKRVNERYICRDCLKATSVKDYNPAVNKCSCGGELVKRPDDTPEVFSKRLEVYEKETSPLIDFYRQNGDGVLSEIKLSLPDREPQETFWEAKECLKEFIHEQNDK